MGLSKGENSLTNFLNVRLRKKLFDKVWYCDIDANGDTPCYNMLCSRLDTTFESNIVDRINIEGRLSYDK